MNKNTKKYSGGKKNKTRKNNNLKGVKINGIVRFSDYPEFLPNLTPREMFKLGSFGGSYWRPIYSNVTKRKHKNVHHKYPSSWWSGIPESHLSSKTCDISKNKYGVRVGTSLDFWESKKWITKYHPYGWVHWYCDFFMGKRCPDDKRQISRWQALAGERGRFMRFLVTLILQKKTTYDDEKISPKIRQVLQHWGYKMTKRDFDKEVTRRKINNL